MWAQKRILKSIINDSVVTCDKIIDVVAKFCIEPTNVNKKRQTII